MSGTRPGAQYVAPANGSRPVAGRSYLVTHLVAGTTYFFTVRLSTTWACRPRPTRCHRLPPSASSRSAQLAAPVVATASNPEGSGYWMANSAGAVTGQGYVANYGSTADVQLNAPIIQIVATPDGGGYWEVASDGGVFCLRRRTLLRLDGR